jgi:hypothetical protein
MALLLVLGACASYRAAQERDRALAVEAEVQRVARRVPLWPGFEPLTIPLALFTGEATWLFRHPAPPGGFTPLRGRSDGYGYAGRHPAVTANSSTDIGGTMTATLLADGPRARQSRRDLAAAALHEAFHVFQRRRHPGWQGNEADLPLYPVDDARLLADRRLESEALRRALDSRDSALARCWTRVALARRRARFAAVDSAFAAYERGTELNEGLAAYVQLRAAGRSRVTLPPEGFAAADVRNRIYRIGPALALLLDRFFPGWAEALEANDRQTLDGLLASAVGRPESGASAPCGFTAAETEAAGSRAAADAAAVVGERAARRRAFAERPGWRVIVEAAAGSPLWPQGFDPLNLESVEGGLLHARFIRLGNAAGRVEVLDGEGADLETLTEAAGAHPLFNGVRRVEIAGLARPEVRREDGRVIVRAPGLTAELTAAEMHERAQEVRVVLR